MKIRTILLAGSVLPFALSTPGLALEQNAVPFILAQAEACAADDADCLAREKKKEERAERRKQQKGEAEQSEAPAEAAPAEAAPAAETAAPAESAPAAEAAPTGETPSDTPAAAEAPAESAPAAAESAEPSPQELRRKQRAERRKQQEEAPAAEAPAAETPVDAAPAVTTTPAAPAAPAESTVQTTPTPDAPAAGAAPAETAQPSARELRRLERERRRLEAEQAQQPAAGAPAAETAPAILPVPAPAAPAAGEAAAPATAPAVTAPVATVAEPGEAQPTSREERRRAREERRRLREQQEAAQPAPAPAPAAPAAPAAGQPAASATAQSTIELQLKSQGSDEQAEQIRELRRKLRAERRDDDGNRDRRRREGETVERRGDRDIIRFGTQVIIRPSENVESERLLYGASDVEVRELPNGFTETIVYRENGSEIVTVRNDYGEIVSRVRRTRGGREVVLIDNAQPEGPPPEIVYFERELPPLVVDVPREEYIVETRRASEEQIAEAFAAPPVETVERAYTLEEIRGSERLRDKVRRVDLDTITFETGSAVIQSDQLDALDQVGVAIEEVLAKNPEEVFLIEGHTDAVGSDESNLLLSDRRAEAVAVALAQDFSIPPENLVTQGYGEEFLKVPTEGAERANRRVTMRNISDLMTASK